MIKIYKWHFIFTLVVVLSSIITPEVFFSKRIKSALAETTLRDIQNHWAKACIEDLLEREIIYGYYEDETFRPNTAVTRAEFATMITKAFPDTESIREPIKFVDVPEDYWGYDAIIEAYEKGFLSGYIGKTFNPTLKISRWQVLTALTGGLNYQASESTVEQLDAIFADAEAIPEESKKAIAAATEKGIVVNYPNVKELNPNQDATRSDVAVFLCQAIANSQQNNGELVTKVPSEYIAKISIDKEQTTTATVPETPTETTEGSANTNGETPIETPAETPRENTNPPGIIEKFGNGNLQAEIIYEQANNTDLVSNLRLKIIRDGEVILNEPVPVKSLENNSESDTSMEVLAGRFVKVQLLDLDGDRESEVLIDLVTINNSEIPLDGGTYSLIYRYQPTRKRYTKQQHFWGNVNYRLTDLDKDNIPEFQSIDTRFARAFTDINNSAFPIQIWQYRQGKMLDVTQQYPVQINTSASELWLEFYRRSTQNQDVKGVLAAYLANKYMLGQEEDGWQLIEKVYQSSDRQEYFADLRQFLADKGYAKNEGIATNAVVQENSSNETEETATFTTNETEETSPQTTTETENTQTPPPETAATDNQTITETENTETTPPETAATDNQTTTETENTETTPPETAETDNQTTTETENTQTTPPETAATNNQTTTETENTDRPITLPPETSSPTTATETTASETAETTNSQTQTENNDIVLAPRLVRYISTPQKDFAAAVAISSDGKILASSSGKKIQLWNLETGKLLHT
ncbi:MAG: S-layer homology domain-containing protein, partial [Microcoleaceae cyanobacterium]